MSRTEPKPNAETVSSPNIERADGGQGGHVPAIAYKELKSVDGKVVGHVCIECGRFHTAQHLPTCSLGTIGNPLDDLRFPVWCRYPGCGDGPFGDGNAVDEHISEEHLAAAVWTFAAENMRARTGKDATPAAPEHSRSSGMHEKDLP